MNRPWIIVVSGPPCSGKSTLAARLADDTAWPVVSKDAWKEVLFDLLGTGDGAWSRKLSLAAFRIQFAVAESRIDAHMSLILEGNFNAAEQAGPVAALADRGGRLLQVACRASAQELARRRRQRAQARVRHPGHLDAERASLPDDPARYAPLPIVPTLVYDSAGDGEGYPRLLRALRRAGVSAGPPPGA
jgi:predicted kinase